MTRPARLRSRRLGTAVLALLIGAACGKVGPPRIPNLALPSAPLPVEVRNVEGGFAVTFPRPRKYLDGVPLDDLGSFEVSRSCAPDPQFLPVADIPVVDRERFDKQSSITLTDSTPLPGQICVYRIVAVTTDDYRSAPAESAPTRREAPAAVNP